MIFSILAACQQKESNVEHQKTLNIAIVGITPDISIDNNIKFTNIEFNELESDELPFDAIFVTENRLSEAAQTKNIKRFKNSNKPIFFIGTKASYFPFIDAEKPLSYEEYVNRIDITNYEISGIIFIDDTTGYQSFNISTFANEDTLSSDDKNKLFSEVFDAIRKKQLHKNKEN